ncbi:metalloprotease, partial [Pyxidicoccus sp. 3LFB2]
MSSALYRKRLLQALVVTGALTAPVALGAAQEPDGNRHYDARTAYNSGIQRTLSAVQASRAAELRKSVPELRVEQDPALGLVRSLTNPVGALTAASSGDALAIALNFVQAQRELLGLELSDVANLEVVDRVYSRVSGVTNLYLRQTYQGVPVYNGQLQVNVDADGRVLGVHSDFLPSLSRAIASAQPRLAAGEAVAGAARHLG